MALPLTGAERLMSRPSHALAPARRAVMTRYSRFVGLMKVMLPAVAAALLGLLILWPRFETARLDRTPSAMMPGDPSQVDTLTMKSPRYFGTDDRNQPFTVTAKTARQIDPQNLAVAIEGPEADFSGPDGTGGVARADHGIFRQKAGILDLSGDVSIFFDDGYEVHAAAASVTVASADVTGDQGFSAQGPAGTLSGQGFQLLDHGARLLCTGTCRMHLRMAAP